jgi:hypothetical protein
VTFARQRVQQAPLHLKALTEGRGVPGDRALQVLPARFLEQFVELLHRLDLGHRHEVAAAEAADLALNAALLMRALLAGQTERRFEAIVRAHRDEPVGLHTAPTLQDLRDRGLQIVIAD